jgi:hypothetical protein
MNSGSQNSDVFAEMVGCIVGALIGGFMAVIVGFLLLWILFKVQPPTGDVTGMGGIILLLLPFGLIGGAVYGVILVKENSDPPENK